MGINFFQRLHNLFFSDDAGVSDNDNAQTVTTDLKNITLCEFHTSSKTKPSDVTETTKRIKNLIYCLQPICLIYYEIGFSSAMEMLKLEKVCS